MTFTESTVSHAYSYSSAKFPVILVKPKQPVPIIAIKWDGTTELLTRLQRAAPGRVRGSVGYNHYIELSYRRVGNTPNTYSVNLGDFLVFNIDSIDGKPVFGSLQVFPPSRIEEVYYANGLLKLSDEGSFL